MVVGFYVHGVAFPRQSGFLRFLPSKRFSPHHGFSYISTLMGKSKHTEKQNVAMAQNKGILEPIGHNYEALSQNPTGTLANIKHSKRQLSGWDWELLRSSSVSKILEKKRSIRDSRGHPSESLSITNPSSYLPQSLENPRTFKPFYNIKSYLPLPMVSFLLSASLLLRPLAIYVVLLQPLWRSTESQKGPLLYRSLAQDMVVGPLTVDG